MNERLDETFTEHLGLLNQLGSYFPGGPVGRSCVYPV